MHDLRTAASYLYDEYREGRFPMAETADGPAMIVTPRERALLPIRELHISRSLLKTLRQNRFTVTCDQAFEQVISSCAEALPDRPETWINEDIRLLFLELHEMGKAHSIECWQEGRLVGGLYGLEVGGVFCGESMFSRVTDASKIALVHLCARLFTADFSLLDAQFHNPHLDQFGLYVLNQRAYVSQLRNQRDRDLDFCLMETGLTEQELVASYLFERDIKKNEEPEGGIKPAPLHHWPKGGSSGQR